MIEDENKRLNEILVYTIEILENILEIDSIKANDHIFVLGTSSLQAIKFLEELSIKYGVPLSINLLFKLKNIKDIAIYIDKNQADGLII